MMCNELVNYAQFFEMIIYRASKNMVRQTVSIIEWKHHVGHVFNEDGPIGLEKELEIFERVQT